MAIEYKDPKDLSYSMVEVHGAKMLFCDERIDRSLIPVGYYQYNIRSDDEGNEPAELNLKIWVNYFGTVISNRAFGCMRTQDGCTIFLDEMLGLWTHVPLTPGKTIQNAHDTGMWTLEAYMEKFPPSPAPIYIQKSERPDMIGQEILELDRRLHLRNPQAANDMG